MTIKKFTMQISAILCAMIIFSFSGCIFFESDGIFEVRNRVETLRKEMSETMIRAFKDKDISAVKNLFCSKTQELKDIDEQIESTFYFMEGNIVSYKIAGSTNGEKYSNEYGKITQYSFGSDVYLTTDTDRCYDLYLDVCYIELDSSIEGMTIYTVSEYDKDYDDIKRCHAGYGWSSPYDAECGIISAKIISAVARKDLNTVKSIFCERTLESPEIDNEIQSVFEFFDGTPLFTEREDGLYGRISENDNDFICRVLGYEIERDKEGSVEGVWVSVMAQNVLTDSGKNYTVDFSAYIRCDNNPESKGVSYFSFEDVNTKEQKQVGAWIYE